MYLFKNKIESLSVLSFCLFLGMMTVITGCDTSNTTEEEATEEEDVIIATISNGEIVQEASDADLRELAAKTHNRLSDDIERQASFFNEVFVEGSGTNFYIIGRGKSAQGNCVSIVTPLAISSQVTSGTAESANGFKTLSAGSTPQEEHKCEGEPCRSCSFIKDENGEIQGCESCTNPMSGQCNHTVGSG